MIIDFKNGQGVIEGICPNCKLTLEVMGLPRWNSYIKCPNCHEALQIHFDFYMDEGEEVDVYDIRKGRHILDNDR